MLLSSSFFYVVFDNEFVVLNQIFNAFLQLREDLHGLALVVRLTLGLLILLIDSNQVFLELTLKYLLEIASILGRDIVFLFVNA